MILGRALQHVSTSPCLSCSASTTPLFGPHYSLVIVFASPPNPQSRYLPPKSNSPASNQEPSFAKCGRMIWKKPLFLWRNVKATSFIPSSEAKATAVSASSRSIGQFIGHGSLPAVSRRPNNSLTHAPMPKQPSRSTDATGIRGARGGRVRGVRSQDGIVRNQPHDKR